MRILLAGATGAIGRPLLPMLIADGHEVFATTRSAEKTGDIAAAGASAEVVDFLEPGAAEALIARVKPDVVIDELTSLPQAFDPRNAKDAYAANDRIRREGTGALIAAAEAGGVERYVVQSVAFIYRPGGDALKVESDPIWSDAPEPFATSVAVLDANEQKVVQSAAFTGVVLRYGFLYGPGTWFETGGSTWEAIKSRKYPLLGGGTGMQSLIHVSDAARATVLAATGAAGIFNVVDDDPAPLSEVVPFVAELAGAKKPLAVPAWLGGLLAGKYLAAAATRLPGASNAKAKAELGWSPEIASWREGIQHYRDSYL